MGIKDILVHVDDSQDCNQRLQVAFKIAKMFDSHVNGLYVPDPVPSKFYGHSISHEIHDAFDEIKTRKIESARELFETESADWRAKSMIKVSEGNVIKNILEYSAYHDLLVLGQIDSSKPGNNRRIVLREIPVESSSPTLLVPYIGSQDSVGKNILIAWDGSREAARAVHYALPFLKQADVVNILSVNIPQKDNVFENDFGEHLSHHGIVAEHHHISNTTISGAECILSWVSDFNADLLVMGIYGHTRLREYVIGGISRTMLESATVPVLFSH
jgi:nucleotide-binding universal stress UspA family protein